VTDEDTKSSSDLVISRNASDSTEVTNFKITNISGGSLFKNDGSSPIVDNDFITFTEGNAGLKFMPPTDSTSNETFNIQASADQIGSFQKKKYLMSAR
jgi:hypothetical protein